MQKESATLTNVDGTTVHFVRVMIGTVTATVIGARWNTAPRGANWSSFGAMSWSLGAETIAGIRELCGLGDTVRISVSTPATEAEVADFLRKSDDHPGERFALTGEFTVTAGTGPDGVLNQRPDKDGQLWVNARLIAGEVTGEWRPVASAAGTTARALALA